MLLITNSQLVAIVKPLVVPFCIFNPTLCTRKKDILICTQCVFSYPKVMLVNYIIVYANVHINIPLGLDDNSRYVDISTHQCTHCALKSSTQ